MSRSSSKRVAKRVVVAGGSESKVGLTQLSVMGLPMHHSPDYVQWLHQRIAHQQGTHVVTLNAEMCMQAQTNPQLHQFIEGADLVAPDGSGILALSWQLICSTVWAQSPRWRFMEASRRSSPQRQTIGACDRLS